MIVGYSNKLVGVDIVGPLPKTPRQSYCILIIADYFTKWCKAVGLPPTGATVVAQAVFDHWIALWGLPWNTCTLTVDSCFDNNVMA